MTASVIRYAVNFQGIITGYYPGKDNPGCVPMPKKIDNRNTSYVPNCLLLPLTASDGL